jgi:hypothetical protein
MVRVMVVWVLVYDVDNGGCLEFGRDGGKSAKFCTYMHIHSLGKTKLLCCRYIADQPDMLFVWKKTLSIVTPCFYGFVATIDNNWVWE